MDQGSSLGEEFQVLREHLAGLSVRRYRRGVVHPLEGVLSLTVLGLTRGCPSLSAIYRFGDTQPRLLSRLGLRRSPKATPDASYPSGPPAFPNPAGGV